MDIQDLQTPAFLADLDVMENNLKRAADAALKYQKQIWPMIKTHKSTELALLQKQYGCTGFLCGTLDEAEALAKAGLGPIMYAYPVASENAIRRVTALSNCCRLILRLDDPASAALVERYAQEEQITLDYTIIVDCGLHRFGIPPEEAGCFAENLRQFPHLCFKGISTHPGHVYASRTASAAAQYAQDECSALRTAKQSLLKKGFVPEIISSGSTPTFSYAIADENIQIYHPGNYIFCDYIQMSVGAAKEEDCALTVLSTIISHPREDLFLCDAGAKCLGLDQGAHGNTAITGYGYVIGHPELSVSGLSEEVGKIHVNGKTDLKTGDRIRIIPNHSCSSANLTSWLAGVRGNTVDHMICVDMRGNSTIKAPV